MSSTLYLTKLRINYYALSGYDDKIIPFKKLNSWCIFRKSRNVLIVTHKMCEEFFSQKFTSEIIYDSFRSWLGLTWFKNCVSILVVWTLNKNNEERIKLEWENNNDLITLTFPQSLYKQWHSYVRVSLKTFTFYCIYFNNVKYVNHVNCKTFDIYLNSNQSKWMLAVGAASNYLGLYFNVFLCTIIIAGTLL